MRTIVIGWQGPYTLESVYESDLGNGLYFVSGRMKYEKLDQIQYFGITERTYRERLKDRHHAVEKVTKNRQTWLGQTEYPSRFTKAHLELAEGCLIYFWGSSKLNRKKLAKPPQPVCLIARWLKPDGEVRLKRRLIYRDLRDVLWWDGEYWRTGQPQASIPRLLGWELVEVHPQRVSDRFNSLWKRHRASSRRATPLWIKGSGKKPVTTLTLERGRRW